MKEFEIVYGELVPVCENHEWKPIKDKGAYYYCEICGRVSVIIETPVRLAPHITHMRKILDDEEYERFNARCSS
jgi:hypothetical protein